MAPKSSWQPEFLISSAWWMPFAVRTQLLRRFVKKFGRHDALRQLQWLKKESFTVSRQQRPSLTGQLHRLLRDEPLAYVIGTQPFGSMSLRVAPPVLIPRPETEEWTYELLNRLKSTQSEARRDWRILDICTGSGCIPLLLCNEWPSQLRGKVCAYGIDIGDEAVALAGQNASRALGRTNSGMLNSYKPRKFDIFSQEFERWISHQGGFDVVTSNPPYIPQKDWEDLARSVKDFEDPRALQAGEDGLVFYRRIAALLANTPLLRHGGWLAVEFGTNQGESVQRILRDSGLLGDIEIWTDCFGTQRAVFCRPRGH